VASQLSLPVKLRAEASFQNFYLPPDSSAAVAVASLKSLAAGRGPRTFYLWGSEGVGCRHLLQATCQSFIAVGHNEVQYLPLELLAQEPPESLLENLEQQALVCISQLQAVAGNRAWELALFDLYNRSQDAGRALLFSADQPPAKLPLLLADLRSRLAAAMVFHLPAYDDAEKAAILQFRASSLGMQLGDDAARYLLSRSQRSMPALMACLNRLDQASLEQQRRLTIPFIRHLFQW